MQRDATTVEAYLDELPPDRQQAVRTLRGVILDRLPPGYEETIAYGMISYVVPLERFPDTYNGKALTYVSLASQKRHVSLYLLGVYGDAASDFRQRWEATGTALDMGKSCVRFRSLDAVPLEVVGDEVARLPVEAFIEQYHDARRSSARR